ncbi:hypothetical protein ACVWWK_004590 [Bradyrhizobium sp. LB9.1b]
MFVLNVVDGCMPSDLGAGTSAELEEERRLLYVAMTRAKDDLHLVVPQRFFTHGQAAKGDRHVYASRTRFIPEQLVHLFERTAWPKAAAGAARTAAQGPKVDIGARMPRDVAVAPVRRGHPLSAMKRLSSRSFLNAGHVDVSLAGKTRRPTTSSSPRAGRRAIWSRPSITTALAARDPGRYVRPVRLKARASPTR